MILTRSNVAHKRPIVADTVLVASREQVSCDASGETVVLSLKSAVYYGLDPIATRIWELFNEPRTVAQVCDALLTEYDVEKARCAAETLDLCEQLVAWKLLEETDIGQARTVVLDAGADRAGATL